MAICIRKWILGCESCKHFYTTECLFFRFMCKKGCKIKEPKGYKLTKPEKKVFDQTFDKLYGSNPFLKAYKQQVLAITKYARGELGELEPILEDIMSPPILEDIMSPFDPPNTDPKPLLQHIQWAEDVRRRTNK